MSWGRDSEIRAVFIEQMERALGLESPSSNLPCKQLKETHESYSFIVYLAQQLWRHLKVTSCHGHYQEQQSQHLKYILSSSLAQLSSAQLTTKLLNSLVIVSLNRKFQPYFSTLKSIEFPRKYCVHHISYNQSIIHKTHVQEWTDPWL